MSNHDDLRDVLRSLEDQAPDVEKMRRRLRARAAASTSHGAPRRATRDDRSRRDLRRFTLPAVAAATVVAGAVALTVVESTGSHGPSTITGTAIGTPSVPATPSTPATTPTSPAVLRPRPTDLTWRFAFGRVKGYTFVRDTVAAGYQTATITARGANKDIAGLTVYPSGPTPSDVRRAMAGERVTVRGATGYYLYASRKALLVWQTTDGGWAVIEGDWSSDVARRSALTVADAIDTGVRDPVAIDFGVRYLPGTLSVAGTTFSADFGGLPDMELDLVDDEPGQDVPGGEHTPAVLIQRGAPVEDNGQPDTPTFKANTTIDGRPAEYGDSQHFRSISIKFPGNSIIDVIVDETHYTDYSKADVLRIARGLTPLGDPARPTTWKPAQAVLPI